MRCVMDGGAAGRPARARPFAKSHPETCDEPGRERHFPKARPAPIEAPKTGERQWTGVLSLRRKVRGLPAQRAGTGRRATSGAQGSFFLQSSLDAGGCPRYRRRLQDAGILCKPLMITKTALTLAALAGLSFTATAAPKYEEMDYGRF